MSSLGLWGKEIAGAFSAGGTAALTALQDGKIEIFEWVGIAAAVVAVFAMVHIVRNATSGPLYYAKALIAAVLAALGALGTALADRQGITINEWVIVFLAVVAAIPVGAVNNSAGESDQIEQDRAADTNQINNNDRPG